MKLFVVAAALPLLGLAGCVTTRPATMEQRASCEQMERNMGLNTTHDHAAMKGMGMNPMNLNHQRCVQILAQPQ